MALSHANVLQEIKVTPAVAGYRTATPGCAAELAGRRGSAMYPRSANRDTLVSRSHSMGGMNEITAIQWYQSARRGSFTL
jgi:hypothetical protein